MSDKNIDLREKRVKVKKVCPECGQSLFKYDPVRDEIFCHFCGLVLLAPATAGITYPGYQFIILKK